MPRMGIDEPLVWKQLEEEGWTVFHTNDGFPDFFCVKNGEVRLVESKNLYGLSKRQVRAFQRLEEVGFKVEIRFVDVAALKPQSAETAIA